MAEKILLIYPPARRIKFFTANFPAALAAVSPILRRAGWQVEVLDINLEGLSKRQVTSRLRQLLPQVDLVGITANMNTFPYLEWLIGVIKAQRPDLPVMAGGPGPTSTAPILLQNSLLDAVACGEGEITAVPLAEALVSGRPPRDVPGAIYKENGEVKYGPEAQRMSNLDSLPRPDYALFRLDKYLSRDESHEKGVSLLSSRGCPYRCTYCYRMLSPEVTRKSPAAMVDEMMYLRRNYGVIFFFMDDDIFTVSHNWLGEFCGLMRQQPTRLLWHCNGRVGTFTPEVLAEMKHAGCHIIRFGLETANEELLKSANKHFSKAQMEESISMVRRAGIINMNSFLVGLPGETTATLRETYDFIDRHKLIIDLSYATPFPYTPLYQLARDKGLITDELAYFRSFSIEHSIYTLRVNFTDLSDATLRRWKKKILDMVKKNLNEMISRKLDIMMSIGLPKIKPFETFAGQNIQEPEKGGDLLVDLVEQHPSSEGEETS